MEFGGNDCDFNWTEISEKPQEEHYSKSKINEFVEIYSNLIKEHISNKKIELVS